MPRVANPANRVARTCQQCGSTFESYPSQPRKFCSRECSGRYSSESGMPRKPRTGRYKRCERCGTEFWVVKSEDSRRRFCSKVCNDTWQGRNSIEKTCSACGKAFIMKPSQAAARDTELIYCSRACWSAAQIQRSLGRMHNGKPAVIDSQGYVRVYEPDHPASYKSGWMAEHRLVLEQALGRRLERGEHVHHINHVRTDNRPENLELMTHSAHSTITAKENREALRAALAVRQALAEYERRFGPLDVTAGLTE